MIEFTETLDGAEAHRTTDTGCAVMTFICPVTIRIELSQADGQTLHDLGVTLDYLNVRMLRMDGVTITERDENILTIRVTPSFRITTRHPYNRERLFFLISMALARVIREAAQLRT
jgi:hypothetical protein